MPVVVHGVAPNKEIGFWYMICISNRRNLFGKCLLQPHGDGPEIGSDGNRKAVERGPTHAVSMHSLQDHLGAGRPGTRRLFTWPLRILFEGSAHAVVSQETAGRREF